MMDLAACQALAALPYSICRNLTPRKAKRVSYAFCFCPNSQRKLLAVKSIEIYGLFHSAQ